MSFWLWRNGYFWQRGFTVTRGDTGVYVGLIWPPVGTFNPRWAKL